jgi:hypothetical protein
MFSAFNTGKVVIDAFRLINPNMMVLGQEPRQTTSNLGHLQKPSVQVVFFFFFGWCVMSHCQCEDVIIIHILSDVMIPFFNKCVESFSFQRHLLEIVEVKNVAKL